MSLNTSPELFLNIKSIPTEDSEEYVPFFENEIKKITYGITINGIYIHGWLYWHLNHWHIYLDELDPINNDIIRKFRNPDFRDNEWLIAEHIKMAEDAKKGLLIFGTRRFSKTVFESSWTARGATIYKGSENVLSSTNSDDIALLSTALEKGVNALHPFFQFERIADNWKKQVTFGYKDKKGKRNEWSNILIRNLDEGRKTEAIAGTTPKTLVIDEIGKANFLEAFAAAKPGFTSTFGWRCMPILTGTGGSFIPNSDAEALFREPESQNFLALEIPNKTKKFGLFVPGTYRMEAKEKTTFGEFIKNKNGILIPAESELNEIPFFVSNPEIAKKLIAEEIEQAKKSGEAKTALKARMYFPLDVEDCFLNEDINNFPTEAIEQQIIYLQERYKNDENLQYVRFYRDVDGLVKKSFDTNLTPITEFPANKNTFKDAPVIIYEDRISERPPTGLYIAGGDPYNQALSENSSSVGTIYIYKRMYDPIGGTYQDMIVASFASRPATMNEWHETVELLLEYYNAVCMPENEGTTFIQWFDQRNKAHYIADGYNALKQIAPQSTVNRLKGLPATPKVKNHYMNLMYEYTKAKLLIGTNPITNEPLYKLGVFRIPDIMLLKEMLAFSKDGNFDRIIAFGHALAYDFYLQKFFPLVQIQAIEEKSQRQQPTVKSPFHTGKRMNVFVK